MKTYQVVWRITVEADTPLDAARQSLEIQRNPESIATIFEVDGSEIDAQYELNGERDDQ